MLPLKPLTAAILTAIVFVICIHLITVSMPLPYSIFPSALVGLWIRPIYEWLVEHRKDKDA